MLLVYHRVQRSSAAVSEVEPFGAGTTLDVRDNVLSSFVIDFLRMVSRTQVLNAMQAMQILMSYIINLIFFRRGSSLRRAIAMRSVHAAIG